MKWLLAAFLATAFTGAAAEPGLLPTAGLAAPRGPQVAVDAQGMVHAVFGEGTAIYATSAAAETLDFTPRVKVAELPKLALGMRRGPRLAVGGGSLLVTAISHEDGMIHGWISTDAGGSWRETEAINTVQASAREGLHALASDGRGLVVCVWLDLRGGGMEVWCRVSRDGGAKWQAEQRVYASPDGHVCQCCVPGVALGPRGEIAVLWRNALAGARDLWTATSTDGGRTFLGARKLGEGTWKLPACPMDGGGLAFTPDGTLTTTWRREKVVFAATLAGPESVLAAEAAQPIVAGNGMQVATLWEKGGALWVRVGDAAPRLLARPARMASVAPLGTGFIAVWEEPHGHSTRLRAESFE